MNESSLIVLGVLAVIWLFIVFPIVVLVKLSTLFNMIEQFQRKGTLPSVASETAITHASPSEEPTQAMPEQDRPYCSPTERPVQPTVADSNTFIRDLSEQPTEPLTPQILSPIQQESAFDSEPVHITSESASTLDMLVSRIWGWLFMTDQFRPAGMTWEYAMATQWLLRIGIGIVLGGVAFFLKYSIERGILGPQGRISLCILVGIILLTSATRMLNKRYHLLAQGFMGMGFSILYFAFFAASNLYSLLTPLHAFACMIGVTVTAGILSTTYHAQMIAWLGLIGGYSTPMLIGSQNAENIGLYAYLTILNCGVLGIAMARYWPLLNCASMLASYYFAFVYGVEATKNADGIVACFVYLSLVHVLFLTSLVIQNLRKAIPTSLSQHLALLANTIIYWTWIFILYLKEATLHEAGLIALTLSALYVALAYYCIYKNKADLMVRNIFIAQACIFLAMTTPLLFSVNTCTLAWSSQAAALMWLGNKSPKNIFATLGNMLFFLCIVLVLVHDFPDYYLRYHAYFETSIICRMVMLNILPAMLLISWHIAKHTTYAIKHLICAIALIFIYCTCESYASCLYYIPAFAIGSITLVWTLFALTLLTMGIRKRVYRARAVGLVLFGLAVAKLLLMDLHDLATPYRILAFIAVGILLVCGSFVYLKYRETFETA